jgi:hypothetical protein
MTDIEGKAVALLNDVRVEMGRHTSGIDRDYPSHEALCRAIEQHEAYKQKVSDITDVLGEIYNLTVEQTSEGGEVTLRFSAYSDAQAFCNAVTSIRLAAIKPKPDPLVDVFDECFNQNVLEGETWSESMARKTRAALEARGLEIREKGQ